jgi:REP element-mobilizing transposase RayT
MLSGVGVRLRTNSNIAFRCAYQVVWCPKYRRPVIGGPMEQRLREIIAEVISEKGVWLIESETMADQVHLLVEVDPQLGVHKLVKASKARSSRLAARGVLVAEVAVAVDVGQLLLCRHRRGCAVLGDQTLRRNPEGPLSHAGGAAFSGRVHRRTKRVR